MLVLTDGNIGIIRFMPLQSSEMVKELAQLGPVSIQTFLTVVYIHTEVLQF